MFHPKDTSHTKSAASWWILCGDEGIKNDKERIWHALLCSSTNFIIYTSKIFRYFYFIWDNDDAKMRGKLKLEMWNVKCVCGEDEQPTYHVEIIVCVDTHSTHSRWGFN